MTARRPGPWEPGLRHSSSRNAPIYPGCAMPDKTALAEIRRSLPDAPGVYLFRDARGRVLYVGKAKSIRKRVNSHFSGRSAAPAGELLARIEGIEFMETG